MTGHHFQGQKVSERSRSPGALLVAMLARQAAAAMGMITRWPWETAATLRFVRRLYSGREGRGHTVAAARLQLVLYKLCGRPPQHAPAPLQVELWTFDIERGVQVTCDVCYLCANFSLHRPLCSRLRPGERDRETSDAHHRYPWGRGRPGFYRATLWAIAVFDVGRRLSVCLFVRHFRVLYPQTAVSLNFFIGLITPSF